MEPTPPENGPTLFSDIGQLVDSLSKLEAPSVDIGPTSIDGLAQSFMSSVEQLEPSDAPLRLEIAYELDQAISDFIDTHGLSPEEHAQLQNDVLGSIRHSLEHRGILEAAEADDPSGGADDGLSVLLGLEQLSGADDPLTTQSDPLAFEPLDDAPGFPEV
ncbi:hypothetical protein EVJ50_06125 [Synechococcus sp. RSCCF101]|uniref:hypothetical protein n=1 Tax=Synechococcus sp. RSCCF101 TaxID=2511069 RepID=UPI0012483764|nr:hypothetical protein [Synechococcus sp. RSCCF101]QEY31882.1 hypothetical protein EVJ50_06125 [Synechococcus sp. RSCCF101]